MNFIHALHWRYAVREFSDNVIAQEQLQKLLDATRLSASSYGLQPFHLLVIQSPEIRQRLLEFSLGQGQITQCSHLIVFAAHTDIGDETVNRYVKKFSEVRGVAPHKLNNM